MLCENCGKPINSQLTGKLDMSAQWGDWCDDCVKDDLSSAVTQTEWREMDLLDDLLRQRPGHVRGANPDDVIDEGRAVIQKRYGVTPS